jgi:hypothetical protein
MPSANVGPWRAGSFVEIQGPFAIPVSMTPALGV